MRMATSQCPISGSERSLICARQIPTLREVIAAFPTAMYNIDMKTHALPCAVRLYEILRSISTHLCTLCATELKTWLTCASHHDWRVAV